MKKDKICPKCGGHEIYTDRGLTKRGERCIVPVSMWAGMYVDVYLCTGCGYFEEYISEKDLADGKKMDKLRLTWKLHA